MPISDLGTISQLGRILQVNNAMVAEVFLRSKTTGYINIIFARTEQNQTVSEFLRLNVSFETAILNSSGQHMCLCDIQKGMAQNTSLILLEGTENFRKTKQCYHHRNQL